MDPATLHQDDQRRALIEYVRDAANRREETTDLLERCESGFERVVLTHLLQRQYKVSVQHRVGSYRIDMVVHGERDRLAIECDGDRFHGPEQWDGDLRRQRVLERLGWKFWRVLASTYYRSPHAALDALWTRLDRLGIDPASDVGQTKSPVPVVTVPPLPEAVPTDPAERAEPEEAPAPSSTESGVAIDAHQEPLEGPAVLAKIEPIAASEPGVESAPAGWDTEAVESTTTTLEGTTPSSETPDQSQPDPSASNPHRVLVPVPYGHRLVGWIRPHEAEAALQAHHSRRDVPVRDGQERVVGWARYHADHSKEAIKYRSNVELQRTSAARGARIVAWLKHPEAEAIVRAAREGQDLRVPASDHHGEFLVQYFSPQSQEATTYRSVTRLLRESR
ncbi:MAG: DUF559 domain-containing protein [Kineosporiaceae bacterium]|nr:DUF559 domain-containing protein [Kineosporiaceae bacterium]